VGSYSVVANYTGDSNYSPGEVTGTLNVQMATTTSLTGNLNPSTQGQPVTFTMNVSPASATGPVDVYGTLNGNPIYLGRGTLANGTASLTTSTLGVGSNVLDAVYFSDATHARSTSPQLTQVVNPALTPTTTTLTTSPNPSTALTSVTLTATVSPATATGSVQFYSNGGGLGSANLIGGQAQLATLYLEGGVRSVTATYSGDATYATSTSAAIQQTVNQVTTTTSLTSSPNPSTLGNLVTLVAMVTPSVSYSTVQFFQGATLLGSSRVTNGQAGFSVSGLALGTSFFTTTFVGDVNLASSTSSAIQQVVKQTTTTTLASSANPSTFGASVALTATVVGTGATGTV
jgi:hypothetical protein